MLESYPPARQPDRFEHKINYWLPILQVLIKVVYSGSNPKDWKAPEYSGNASNSGDDIAGIVEAVGENVVEFKKGDRVAAFHEMRADHGSFAEYAIAWAHTTFHLPKKISFEEVSLLEQVEY